MSPRQSPVEGPVKADFSAFPDAAGLPPVEGGAKAGSAGAASAAEVAALQFLDPASMSTTVPFDHPFTWDGVRHDGVVVRRLSFAEVGRVYERARDADGSVPIVEFYAEMTGLPAAVIRGMEAGDAQKIVDAGHPLLPRQLRSEISTSTSESGDASA